MYLIFHHLIFNVVISEFKQIKDRVLFCITYEWHTVLSPEVINDKVVGQFW